MDTRRGESSGGPRSLNGGSHTVGPNERVTDERAISPVVGVSLLIAIAVVLTTVIGVAVFGIGPPSTGPPEARLTAEFHLNASNPEVPNQAYPAIPDHANARGSAVTIHHMGGDPLPADKTVFIMDDGTEVTMHSQYPDDKFTAGGNFTLDLSESSTSLTVVWENPQSETETIVANLEV